MLLKLTSFLELVTKSQGIAGIAAILRVKYL